MSMLNIKKKQSLRMTKIGFNSPSNLHMLIWAYF